MLHPGVMGRTAQCALALAALAISGGLASACLSDLQEPTQCPPEPQVAAGDCMDAISNPPVGCFSPERMGCLTGGRSDCKCISDECPEPEHACFPPGDCPPEVSDKVSSKAACKRLEPADIGLPWVGSMNQCLCGCLGCAAVCDGRGPVMGVRTGGKFFAPAIVIDVADRMPSSGRLGIYLRVRGFSFFTLAIGLSDFDQGSDIEWSETVYLVMTPLSSTYVDHLIYADPVTKQPYVWDRYEDRPRLIALIPEADSTKDVLELFELDCVVPFVVPL